jgi:hypothetical protein
MGFCNQDAGLNEELKKTQLEVPLLQKLQGQSEQIYSAGLTAELRDFMKARMIWQGGEWHGRFTWTMDGKAYEQKFVFMLSSDDVARAASISKYYGAGYGVYPELRFYPVGVANPSIVITLHE